MWQGASTAPPESCTASRPQLVPLVLHRAPPLVEEGIELLVRPLVAVLHLVAVCAARRAVCTLAGVRSRSRACRSSCSATKTRRAARWRPTCLLGQLGATQQRAFACWSRRERAWPYSGHNKKRTVSVGSRGRLGWYQAPACGAMEAYVPGGPAWNDAAARVRMVEQRGPTLDTGLGAASQNRRLARQSWVVRA